MAALQFFNVWHLKHRKIHDPQVFAFRILMVYEHTMLTNNLCQVD